MSINQDILDYYADRLRVLGKVSIKRMFGGAGFYLNGRMFALTDGDDVYLKADEETRGRFEARKMKQFAPFEDKPAMKMGYYCLSSEDLEDDDALWELCKLAIEASNRTAQKKKPSETKRAKSKS
ncbi:MAG: TfoX/Sxy family protein [bacterium]|nr:TfoX/Sxy family protein [bacterium]